MRHFSFMLAAIVAAFIFCSPMQAHAEDKTAVVDVQALMNDSKAGKSVQAQLTKHQETMKTEFSKLEKDLKDMQASIAAEKDPKSEAVVNKKKTFETKMLEANKMAQERRAALETAASTAILDLRKEIVKVVADISDKNGYTLVMTRQDVVLASKEKDITEQVMTQLDKQLPDLKVNFNSSKSGEKPKNEDKKS